MHPWGEESEFWQGLGCQAQLSKKIPSSGTFILKAPWEEARMDGDEEASRASGHSWAQRRQSCAWFWGKEDGVVLSPEGKKMELCLVLRERRQSCAQFWGTSWYGGWIEWCDFTSRRWTFHNTNLLLVKLVQMPVVYLYLPSDPFQGIWNIGPLLSPHYPHPQPFQANLEIFTTWCVFRQVCPKACSAESQARYILNNLSYLFKIHIPRPYLRPPGSEPLALRPSKPALQHAPTLFYSAPKFEKNGVFSGMLFLKNFF